MVSNPIEPLIDIGSNLLDKQLLKNIDSVVSNCKKNNIKHIVITSSRIEDTTEAKSLINKYPEMFSTTVGFHPHNAKFYKESSYNQMLQLAKEDYVVAIGECGLDYRRNYSEPKDQVLCFKRHLDLATNINLPMFLHEREAHEDFIGMLREYISQIENAVVHCFTGDLKALKNYLDIDCYIGITGWITDPKRGYHLHDIIKYIPEDRLLIETDSPYLMPFSYKIKNKKYNEPANLIYILDFISKIMKKKSDELASQLYNNTCNFFNFNFK